MARDQGSLSTIHRPHLKHTGHLKSFHRKSSGQPFPWNTYTLTWTHIPTHIHMCVCTWVHREMHTHSHVSLCSYTLTHALKVTTQREMAPSQYAGRENSRRGIFLTGILSCPSDFFSWTKGKEPTTSPLPVFSQGPLTAWGALLFRPSQPGTLGLANYPSNDNHLFLHPGGRKKIIWTQTRIMKLECSKY